VERVGISVNFHPSCVRDVVDALAELQFRAFDRQHMVIALVAVS
jgi:hypothetical protein